MRNRSSFKLSFKWVHSLPRLAGVAALSAGISAWAGENPAGLAQPTFSMQQNADGSVSTVFPGGLPPAAQNALAQAQGAGAANANANNPLAAAMPSAAPAPKKEEKKKVEAPTICDINVGKYDTVDIHAQNVAISTVLEELAVKSRRNIILAADADRAVSMTMYAVPFFDALAIILDVNGLGFAQEGDFIKVFTKEQLRKREQGKNGIESRIFYLRYLRAKDAKTAVEGLLSENGKAEVIADDEGGGAGGGSGGGGDSTSASPTDAVYSPTAQPFVFSSALVIHDYEENIAAIAKLVANLDKRPKQVLIEASILEVQLDDQSKFGVDLSLLSGSNLLSGNVDLKSFASGTGAGSNSFKADLTLGGISAVISALDKVTHVSVLSSPKIMSLDRQRSQVFVGNKVSYQEFTVSDGVVSPSTKFADDGISLDVRPHILPDGKIRLTVMPKVSNITMKKGFPVKDGGGEVYQSEIPDIAIRAVAVDILVPQNATAVIGGLFREATQAIRSQVPGVGDLPIVGVAARTQDDVTQRRELIFLLHPVVIEDTEVATLGERSARDSAQILSGERRGLLPWSRLRQGEQLALRAHDFIRNNNPKLGAWTYDRSLEVGSHKNQVADATVMRGSSATPSADRGILHRDIMKSVRHKKGDAPIAVITGIEGGATYAVNGEEWFDDGALIDAEYVEYVDSADAEIVEVQSKIVLPETAVARTAAPSDGYAERQSTVERSSIKEVAPKKVAPAPVAPAPVSEAAKPSVEATAPVTPVEETPAAETPEEEIDEFEEEDDEDGDDRGDENHIDGETPAGAAKITINLEEDISDINRAIVDYIAENASFAAAEKEALAGLATPGKSN
ncbi:hypothetical protein FACS1894139_05140 [Planctomycetales bacterium]|nr:hypothetical protein FACS1894107_03120 [Planctomycetales bacterium]GHS97088.1 hypothetical protein FACS1894108_02880 [Planctomycetales bacterium]GHT03882.1 hypothetical protein FACS1894139_05140 [Planctomycetales bacterium]